MNIEILKDQIKERYEDKRPGVAINKCIRFIEEVKFCSCCHKQIMHDEEYETVNGYYFHKKDC